MCRKPKQEGDQAQNSRSQVGPCAECQTKGNITFRMPDQEEDNVQNGETRGGPCTECQNKKKTMSRMPKGRKLMFRMLDEEDHVPEYKEGSIQNTRSMKTMFRIPEHEADHVQNGKTRGGILITMPENKEDHAQNARTRGLP